MAKRRPTPTSPNLERHSANDLRRELAHRQKSVVSLTRRRARVAAKLADLDHQLAAVGAVADGRRPRNERSLVDAILAVMKGKQMSIAEIIASVRTSGYRSSSANFRVMVNERLITSGKFKRVARGVYTAK